MNKARLLTLPILAIFIAFGLASANEDLNGSKDGEKKPHPIPLSNIVGGTIADENEYPWQVALVAAWETNPRAGQFCGGSLIAHEWVLTAAHCLVSNGNVVSADSVDAIVGINQLTSGPTVGETGQRIDVDQIIIHPNYDPFSEENDIALLHLNTSASLSCSVNTIAYATEADSELFSQGKTAIITGWGDQTDGAEAGSNDLREVAVPIVSNVTCQGSYGSQVTENMLCAGLSSGGRDSCQGDSGGPLIVSNGRGGFLQAGVVSWGNGCAQPQFFGVYTRVSNYESWIDGYLNSRRGSAAPLSTIEPSLNHINVLNTVPRAFMPFISNQMNSGARCVPGSVTPPPGGGGNGADSSDVGDAIQINPGDTVSGSVNEVDDRDDVFKIDLQAGDTLFVVLEGSGGDADLYLYPPGTATVNAQSAHVQHSQGDDSNETIVYEINETGTWYIDVYSYRGFTTYELTVTAG